VDREKLIAPGGVRVVLRDTNRKSDGLQDHVIQALQTRSGAENRGGTIWYELTR
jgi:hypothetical protein